MKEYEAKLIEYPRSHFYERIPIILFCKLFHITFSEIEDFSHIYVFGAEDKKNNDYSIYKHNYEIKGVIRFKYEDDISDLLNEITSVFCGNDLTDRFYDKNHIMVPKLELTKDIFVSYFTRLAQMNSSK